MDAEEALLAVSQAVTIAYFPEATTSRIPGHYDVSLVEGSITTEHDVEMIKEIRSQSALLAAIGACATAGGIQALRNFKDVKEFTKIVYAKPEYISTLAASTPISDHVKVDFELRGCPISKKHLLELVRALLRGAQPNIRHHSVCIECKRNGTVCVMVAKQTPCLGPVTHAGCGAICPSFNRGCYGCFGPAEDPNTAAVIRQYRELGKSGPQVREMFRNFNVWSAPFRKAQEEAI